jgi:hypothetical protein
VGVSMPRSRTRRRRRRRLEGQRRRCGTLEITESTPASHIAIQLDFIRSFEGQKVDEFTLVPDGNATKVTWAMHGPNRYSGR